MTCLRVLPKYDTLTNFLCGVMSRERNCLIGDDASRKHLKANAKRSTLAVYSHGSSKGVHTAAGLGIANTESSDLLLVPDDVDWLSKEGPDGVILLVACSSAKAFRRPNYVGVKIIGFKNPVPVLVSSNKKTRRTYHSVFSQIEKTATRLANAEITPDEALSTLRKQCLTQMPNTKQSLGFLEELKLKFSLDCMAKDATILF